MSQGSAARLRGLGDEVLAGYAQVFFARGRATAALVLCATLTQAHVGLSGIFASLVASGTVRVMKLNAAKAARGHYGYNALLAGLALGAFVDGAVAPGRFAALLLFTAAAVVLLQAAIESALGSLFNLPSLTLPFAVATCLSLLFVHHVQGLHPAAAFAQPSSLPVPLALYLRSLGAMFFVPEIAAGALVLVGLIAWSRIGALLSIVGFGAAQGILALASPELAHGHLAIILGYNGAATAIALGGVWFVPQRSSFVLAAVCVPLTCAFAFAASAVLDPLGLPVLILPFNLAAFTVLHAMRQRESDGAPKSVDFAPGTPEENLAYYRTRLARFGARLGIRMRLPFRGRWTVTQGIDGAHTHQGEWRHALDFEVLGEGGRPHDGSGTALKDYHCYRLPVFAAAAGTVVRVKDGVADNAPGERNASDAWGNVVVLQHGPSLFSLVAHLSPGTIEVVEGQFVTAGARLGLCGNSGRSFVPHLHFQLQASARPGAATCELEFSDVVVEREEESAAGAVLSRVHVPLEGEAVRNVEPADEIAALFAMPLGARWSFETVTEGGRAPARRETVTCGIDLFNNVFLESESGGGRLYFERQAHQFIVYDHLGPRDSVLRLLYAAVPRVPFESCAGLLWDDVLPYRAFRSRAAGWLLDFIDPFLPRAGQRLVFLSGREGSTLVVSGRGRSGRTRIETRARFVSGTGLCELSVRAGEVLRSARLVNVEYEVPSDVPDLVPAPVSVAAASPLLVAESRRPDDARAAS